MGGLGGARGHGRGGGGGVVSGYGSASQHQRRLSGTGTRQLAHRGFTMSGRIKLAGRRTGGR